MTLDQHNEPRKYRVTPDRVDEKGRYVWACPRCGHINRNRTALRARGCACGTHVVLVVGGNRLTKEDSLRAAAYRHSAGRCFLCGGVLFVPFTVDHLRAQANGGPRRAFSNVAAAHRECNVFKGCWNLSTFRAEAQRAINDAAELAGIVPPRVPRLELEKTGTKP